MLLHRQSGYMMKDAGVRRKRVGRVEKRSNVGWMGPRLRQEATEGIDCERGNPCWL